jgi:flavin reductase (DIM6/NTAB) family NADH-FMN oxidoreductase RutF
MTIHSEHPFRDPDPDPARRFRGRLGGAVTLWTAGGDRVAPAGLTVSSVLLANGEPPSVLALLDPDSDLAEALEGTGRAVVALLGRRHRDLAEAFAGLAPAPGGPFRQASFTATSWGPRLDGAGTWAGVALADSRPAGWSTLVTCTVEHLEVDDDGDVLLTHRGRYLSLGATP